MNRDLPIGIAIGIIDNHEEFLIDEEHRAAVDKPLVSRGFDYREVPFGSRDPFQELRLAGLEGPVVKRQGVVGGCASEPFALLQNLLVPSVDEAA